MHILINICVCVYVCMNIFLQHTRLNNKLEWFHFYLVHLPVKLELNMCVYK